MEEETNNDINININLPLISNDKPKQEDNPFILPTEAEASDTMTISKNNCGNTFCKIIILIILVLCSIIPVFFNVPETTIIIILPLVLCLYLSLLSH